MLNEPLNWVSNVYPLYNLFERGGTNEVGTSDEFQIEEAMISSSSAECADDGMH